MVDKISSSDLNPAKLFASPPFWSFMFIKSVTEINAFYFAKICYNKLLHGTIKEGGYSVASTSQFRIPLCSNVEN